MMRKVLLIFVLSICTLLTLGLGTPGPQITPEQAKEIVREWEGNPNLVLPEPTLEWDTTDPYDIPQYEFVTNKYYSVDAVQGYVSMVIIAEPPRNPSWNITPAQAQSIATQFCSQKYPNFNTINWETTVRRWEKVLACYEVVFEGKMPNGAYTLNYISVDIHPDSGEVLSYVDIIPASPPPQWEPNVPRNEAITRAIEATGFVEILNIPEDAISLIGGNGMLTWTIEEIDGILPNGKRKLAWVSIDAIDGSIVNLDYCRSYRLTPLRGHIMVAGELIKKSEGPLFKGDKCYISLRLFQTLGGKSEKIPSYSGESLRENGKDFISVGMLEKLLPDIVERVYIDKKRQAVYIIIKGDLKGAESLLPVDEVLKLQERWYLLPEGKYTRDKSPEIAKSGQKRWGPLLEKIKENLKKEKLIASEKEVKREFLRPLAISKFKK